MHDVRYRPMFTEPGDSLLAPASPLAVSGALSAFSRMTNLGLDVLISSPVVFTPMPRYMTAEGPRQFRQVNPASLWHPLFWLPVRLAGSYDIPMPDGTTEPESPDHHLVRVVTEMSMAGLYDEQSGEWADCMSMIGIDVDEPGDVQRIQDWLEGGSDPDLDGFSLDAFLTTSDAMASYEVATAMLPDLMISCWAMHSKVLADMIDGHLDGSLGSNVDTLQLVVGLTELAAVVMPPDAPGDFEGTWTEWEDLIEAVGTCEDIEAARREAIPLVVDQLRGVEKAYWGRLERAAVEADRLMSEDESGPRPVADEADEDDMWEDEEF